MANLFTLFIFHNNFGPHHVARLDAIISYGIELGINVIGIELASRESKYSWMRKGFSEAWRKITLFHEKAYEDVPRVKLVRAVWSTLNTLNPQALAICGYKQWDMLAALAWARLKRRLVILMMDSKYDDYPRHRVKEWIKRRIVSLCDAAMVSGTQSREYVIGLGMHPDRIFTGWDVVDNDYFFQKAEWARENAFRLREEYRLPNRYFLCVSRFVEGKGKNISRLLRAYAQYEVESGDQARGLVICGSGPLENQLKKEAQDLGIEQVYFPGFVHIDKLPIYYGLANCLIIPSLGDTWSLVVNEAMAAGLPVLVSKACGCAPNLVREGENGYTFDPYNEEIIVELMLRLSRDHVDLKVMGMASRHIISKWSLESCSQNLFKALHAAQVHRKQDL